MLNHSADSQIHIQRAGVSHRLLEAFNDFLPKSRLRVGDAVNADG